MQDARATYERALAIDRELGDGDAQAKVLNSLAIVHAEQGRFDEARAHFESALSISRELGDRRQEGLVLGNLGSLNIEQGRLGTDASNPRPRSRSIATPESGSRRARRWPTSPCSTRQPVVSRPREAISSPRWRSRAMRATAARRVSSSVAWALSKAKAGSSTGRACTTTRRSPSIAPSAIVAAKAWCSRSWPTCLHGRAGTKKRAPCWRKAEAHLRALGEKLDLAGLLCLRGRLELAAGEPERARRSLDEANTGAEALDLDPDASCGRRSPRCARRSTPARPTAR